MVKAWVVAALALLPAQAVAGAKCDQYVARDYPDARITETESGFTAKWERYEETYIKTMSKRFGMLVEAAGVLNQAEEHTFAHEKINGVDVLIFDSIVFLPNCGK